MNAAVSVPEPVRARRSHRPAALRKFRLWLTRQNWSLLAGLILVGFLILVAWQGPALAPADPMRENYAVKVGGRFYSPPFPAFTVPGYPLGSDGNGRDLFSRLLWAVRPTLLMVVSVAAVRLGLGTLVGLVSGWSTGPAGRFWEGLISAGLAVPVLLVALGGITLLGTGKGLAAFIFGLSLNGWAETARMVHEQTRTIKQQPYVLAAEALGGTPAEQLFRHVLRQIMPMLWMMLAFEISATLLVAAELGFLGYYVGGGVWVEVSDFVAVNITGLPELGQMLSASLIKLTDPWGLLAVSGMVFIAILGFNLLGEGLRAGLSPDRMRPNRVLNVVGERVNEWLEERVLPGVSVVFERRSSLLWGIGVFLAVTGGWLLLGRIQHQTPTAVPGSTQAKIPGSPHLWPMERHDAQGTAYASVKGPRAPRVAWMISGKGSLVGGPVVAQDGTIYVGAEDSGLMAVSPDGKVLLEMKMDAAPLGSPAIGKDGEIYVVDVEGGLTAFDPQGEILWHSTSKSGVATSGPVVAQDGMIYYTVIDSVRAVSPQGEVKGFYAISENFAEFPPRLSPGENMVFLWEGAIVRDGGGRLAFPELVGGEQTFTDPRFLVGADGKLYLLNEHNLLDWKSTSEGGVTGLTRAGGQSGQFPYDAGAVPDGSTWMLYSGDFADTYVLWFDPNGNLSSKTRLAQRAAQVVGVDQDRYLYSCGAPWNGVPSCLALAPGSDVPTWSILLEETYGFLGGALLDGRMYASTEGGFLYALVDE